jgi:UDP-N-acetylglucosamine:LPS N-acetylglucosamine transferase
VSDDVFALVTGGGTGGHVYPALAVADELVQRGHARGSVRFVGARRGLEASAVPEAGYAIDLLGGRGVRRSFSPRAVLANIGALFGWCGAFFRAFKILGQRTPKVVLGVGGYASAACVIAARLRRVPAVVHEQNAAPGIVNRVAVRLGARAAVSLPGTDLRGATLTGNPVRAAIAEIERAPDEGHPLVVVTGGSLGAGSLNDAVLGLYDLLGNLREWCLDSMVVRGYSSLASRPGDGQKWTALAASGRVLRGDGNVGPSAVYARSLANPSIAPQTGVRPTWTPGS